MTGNQKFCLIYYNHVKNLILQAFNCFKPDILQIEMFLGFGCVEFSTIDLIILWLKKAFRQLLKIVRVPLLVF